MADPVRSTYRRNLNRNPTKKWAEAQQVDYGGDDWGDEYDDYRPPLPEPVSAGPSRHPGWGQRVEQRSQKNVTSPPPPAANSGRPSYDTEDDRRYFSTGSSDQVYQGQPTISSSLPHEDYDHTTKGAYEPPTLQVNTQFPDSNPGAQVSSHNNARQNTSKVPFSAPVGHQPQSFHPGSRAEHQQSHYPDPMQGQQASGLSIDTAGHTPRQSSLSQQKPLQKVSDSSRSAATVPSSTDSEAIDTNPLPFVRPADIYKRVNQEREKERRSQDSSRPSIDSTSGKIADSPARAAYSLPTQPGMPTSEEAGSSRKARSTFDTAVGRKIEHGLSPTSAGTTYSPKIASNSKSTSPSIATAADTASRPQISRAASSVYTDRPDPTSATSTGSHPIPSVVGSANPLSAESYQQNIYQYSTSKHRLSGLQSGSLAEETGEDFPNYNHGFSSKPTTSLSSPELMKAESPLTKTDSISRSPPIGPDQLQHQPSIGIKSTVHQAFDAGQSSIMSPTSTSDTVARTNSTSEISPIIQRTPDIKHAEPLKYANAPKPAYAEHTPTQLHDRSESVSTIKALEQPQDNTILPATTFVPGYRRDNTPPVTETTKARRPLSIEVPVVPEAQHGVLSTVTTSTASGKTPTTEMLPATQYTPIAGRQSPPKQFKSQSDLSRTESEDWSEWRAQSRKFKAIHGLQDSDTASPTASSPVSRSESPVKGTVRDIAGKLDTNSGRSSPAIAHGSEGSLTNTAKPSKPTARLLDAGPANMTKILQNRNDSFRPSLPGAWQSYTTDESGPETTESRLSATQPTTLREQGRVDSTDSVPTATAPRQWQSSRSAHSDAAFAAAAAAGSAMAGAFSGSSLSRDSSPDSDLETDEEDTPSASQPQISQISETRDFALKSPQTQLSNPTSDTPISKPLEPHEAQSNIDPSSGMSKQVDYPAPLRTSRLFENRQPSPRLSIPSIAGSGTDEGLEQLQLDIVQSLTPKLPVVPGSAVQLREMPLKPRVTSRQFSIISDDGDTLPREYSSYWDDQQASVEHKDILEETSEEQENVETKPPVQMPPVQAPPKPAPALDNRGPTSETTPFLEQRYSWEAPKTQLVKTSESSNAESAKSTAIDRPLIPTNIPVQPPSTLSPPTPTVHRVEEDDQDTPRNSVQPATLPTKPLLPLLTFPKEKTEFRNILAFKEPSQRIHAFNENRQLYAQPNGLLEQWISSLNTPEHSDVFRSSRLPRAQTNIGPIENRPSPQPKVTATSGTKQMQEDGKRLLVAAGKYGGRAGTVAKGLFAKGKDKFRTVSSGEKVPTTGRRRSSNVEIEAPVPPRPYEPPVLPDALPEQAPQIPTPVLETPTGESSFSALTQMFRDQSHPSNSIALTSNTRSADWNRGPGGRPQEPPTNQSKPWAGPTSSERPPATVIASLPGRDEVPAKSQVFPNYNAGTKADKNAAVRGVAGQASSRDPVVVPQSSIGADRPRKPQREDSSTLPHPRRPSFESDVSEISVAQDEAADVLPRNVSPSLENASRGHRIPLIVAPQLTKEEEVIQNRNRSSLLESTLPNYNSTKLDNTKQPRIQPGTQIVPVADLKPSDAEGDHESDSRPFSFFGSETLNRAISQHEPVRPPPVPVVQQSPVEQDLPVDIEKSPQPNITEHPAYRSSGRDSPDVEQANPLPSSRRQDPEQARKHKQIAVPERTEGEGGYRIPGPYGQEFRSRPTKPMTSQDSNQQFHSTPDQSPNVSSPIQSRFSTDVGRGRTPDVISQPEQPPEPERVKGRGFSSMFRTRSKSPNKQYDRQGAFSLTPQSDNILDEGKKRKPFFSLNSHSSQGYDNRDASLQDTGRDRKLSIDMLRGAMFTSKTQPDGKKKRSSGFGALFGKTNGKDRDDGRYERTTPQPYTPQSSAPQTSASQTPAPQTSASQTSTSQPSAPPSAPQPPAQQPSTPNYQRTSMGNHIAAQMQYPTSAGEARHNTGQAGPDSYAQYDQPSSKLEGRYGIPDSAYQETKAYHNPEGQHFDQEKSGMNDWQQRTDRSQMYPQPSNNAVSAVPWVPNNRQMSSESSTPPVSASPIPSTRANRDISYGQDRPYIPPVTSPRPAHGAGQVGMADHVKNLHKRSRSPRLGRPPSDEHLQVDQINLSQPGRRYSPDPASKLGTFVSKSMSPGGGVPRSAEDQEKPWTIGLPEGNDDDDSDSDALFSNQTNKPATSETYRMGPEPGVVSPATPYQQAHHDNVTGIVSPMTAVEPRAHGFGALSSPTRPDVSREAGANQPNNFESEHIEHRGRKQNNSDVETVAVPPTISSAGQIPHPNPQSHDNNMDEPTQPTTSLNQPLTQPSGQPSRGMKQALIERGPNSSQAESPIETRPQTVAEKVMGVQMPGRGAVPEHRSTTPVSHSPAPAASVQQKSTTWPDARPSTTAVTTNTGTTVTTTTMRTGSKLGKGSIKTNTYIVDSNTPSRTNSNAVPSGNKNISNAALSVPASGSVLTPITTNTNGNAKSQPSSDSKNLANGANRPSHGKSFDAVELPGSRPDGYESEEEIVMSATTYPGQEWMPEFDGAVDWE